MIYFVTGGSRGIGEAIVLQAVKEGHDVAFTYVNAREQAEQVEARAQELRPEARVRAYRLDVRDSGEVEQVGDQVLDDFDTVHVVVNNAGVNRDNLAAYMSDEEWHEVIATDLDGPFFVCRHFLTTMLANKFGRIINVSSITAHGATGQINYATAKAGLRGLTRSLAKEYGPKGITANVVMPGFFDTEMTRLTMSEDSKFFWGKYCPARRIGRLDEIGAVVTFLGSEASSFINGAEIPVTGGLEHAP